MLLDAIKDYKEGGYDENDPKHPDWAQRHFDNADLNESVEFDRMKALTKRLLG